MRYGQKPYFPFFIFCPFPMSKCLKKEEKKPKACNNKRCSRKVQKKSSDEKSIVGD